MGKQGLNKRARRSHRWYDCGINPSEEEKMRTKELIKLWKASIPAEGLKSLTIKERKGGPPGLI